MKNFTCESLKITDRSDWDTLLCKSSNGTFYQSLPFLELNASKAEHLALIIFKKENALIGGFAGGVVSTPEGDEIRAPFAASFGAFFHLPNVSLEDALAMLKETEQYARSIGAQRIVIQQPPGIYLKEPDEKIEFALRYHGFSVEMSELTLYLTTMGHCSSTLERNVRKATKMGLTFQEVDDARAVGNFIQEHKELKGIPMSVGAEEMVALHQTLGNKIRFFTACSYENRVIAGLMVNHLNETAALGFNWAHEPDHQHLRPTDFILYRAADKLFSEGLRLFDLGTATRGGEPDWGITSFKEKFGARGAMRTRYAKEIIP